MIPVKDDLIRKIYINNDRDKSYLNMEFRFLRQDFILKRILKKCEYMFNVLENQKHFDHKFFQKLCINNLY